MTLVTGRLSCWSALTQKVRAVGYDQVAVLRVPEESAGLYQLQLARGLDVSLDHPGDGHVPT